MKKVSRRILIPILALILLLASATTAFASTRLWNQFPTVRKGNVSYKTTLIQRILYESGYFASDSAIDANFGSNTYTHVKNYQRDHGCQVDGVVGPDTWSSFDYGSLTFRDWVGLGTGVYQLNYTVDGTYCVYALASLQEDGIFEYWWHVKDRHGSWRDVCTINSNQMIMY